MLVLRNRSGSGSAVVSVLSRQIDHVVWPPADMLTETRLASYRNCPENNWMKIFPSSRTRQNLKHILYQLRQT